MAFVAHVGIAICPMILIVILSAVVLGLLTTIGF